MKFLGKVALAVVLLGTFASAKDQKPEPRCFRVVYASPARDGSWWNQLSVDWKRAYIIGYIEASLAERRATAFARENAPLDGDCFDVFQDDFDGITFTQFIAGLDVLYSDYRNQQIQIGAAIAYVRDEIRGEAADSLQRELLDARQNGAKSAATTAASPSK